MAVEKKASHHAGHRQRRKEQFLRHGLDAFAPHEALELLLYYALPRVDTNPIAHALLEHFGSLNGVFSAPVEELVKIDGIGENTALLLRLVPELFRYSQMEPDRRARVIRDSAEAGEFLKKYFWFERREIVVELCLDSRCSILSCRKLSEGSASGGEFNLRDAVRLALECNASYVYFAHNHPSGVAMPSYEDAVATRALQQALAAVGIRLLDHLVMAEDEVASMAASGMLDGI